jgi:hypothetical protein
MSGSQHHIPECAELDDENAVIASHSRYALALFKTKTNRMATESMEEHGKKISPQSHTTAGMQELEQCMEQLPKERREKF